VDEGKVLERMCKNIVDSLAAFADEWGSRE
jgi:hypothetical protein